MRTFYIHNLMLFPMVCAHLRHLPIIHIKYALPPLGSQNATGPPTEFAKSNHSNVHLQTNAISLPQSPQPISPSHSSGDHTHHNIKYLEQLLDSSLATAAVIQFSGNTLADVLTPRAYDSMKALYVLAALDAPASSTTLKPGGSEIPTRSTFSDFGNDCFYSNNRSESPPLPNSSFMLPRTGMMHISANYVVLFSGLAAVSFLVIVSICLGLQGT